MRRSRCYPSVGWCLFAAAMLLAIGGCRRESGPVGTVAGPAPPAEPTVGETPRTSTPPPSPAEPAVSTPSPPPMTDGRAEPASAPAEDSAAQPEYDPQKAVPLADNPERLQRLDPAYPVWFDKQERRVLVAGQICAREVPLELFACLRGTKEHEAIITVDTRAHIVHAGLLAAGANPGNPVQFYPEYVPAAGSEIEVTVVWQDEKGQRRTARAQDWIRNLETKEAMQYPWVFAGSQFTKDEQTGQQYYQADGGDFICVSNFPSAMLDLPIKSSDSNAALVFEAYTDRIPPLGTSVTLILKPVPK